MQTGTVPSKKLGIAWIHDVGHHFPRAFLLILGFLTLGHDAPLAGQTSPVTAVFSGPMQNEDGTCKPATPTTWQTNANGFTITASVTCGDKIKANVQ